MTIWSVLQTAKRFQSTCASPERHICGSRVRLHAVDPRLNGEPVRPHKERVVMYATLMVYLDPFADNAHLLHITADLAERLDASVLGVSACRLVGVDYDVGGIPGGVVDVGHGELIEAMEAARQAALAVFQGSGRHIECEWRSILHPGPLEASVIRQTRSADLVIASANYRESLTRGTPYLNIGDLVMQSGRPVLIIPPAITEFKARKILVGWKDTREARRAVADALPLLQMAERVVLVQIANKKDIEQAEHGVADVVSWLKRHQVPAQGMTLAEHGRNGPQLAEVAMTEGIDLIVAGAYGHSRFRQWVLGGVTHNLLLYGDLSALVSH
ncbi:universal stress protein [Rhodanobacter sp. AS-Z3]|uniref:universal stress protein n=1 Tax=Rhodanobacter sp. AS-Z3 TaxID=3031330 RepID=UPI00247B1947|nr:universal stress protein [Rhodanobacter sp. AS-Z3]WEN14528.1 universal stress protein [Rhodanobacter sp. AS-Z3]